jgi:hypothetical protein
MVGIVDGRDGPTFGIPHVADGQLGDRRVKDPTGAGQSFACRDAANICGRPAGKLTLMVA